jgi:hypothetical protein
MGGGGQDPVNMGSLLREQARRAQAEQEERRRVEAMARYAEAFLAGGEPVRLAPLLDFVAVVLRATQGHHQITLRFTDGRFRQRSHTIGPLSPDDIEALAASAAEEDEARRSGRLKREPLS